VPGDSTLVVDRPMRPTDVDDHPIEWARFEQKKENRVSGTPLEAWSILSDTQKAEFNALHIFTIDQFAQLPDSVGNKIMGFNDLRDKARTFILAAKDSKLMDNVRAETEKVMQTQAAEIAQLREMINDLTSKKAGRPKKETVEE
jgi:hypothetical protein